MDNTVSDDQAIDIYVGYWGDSNYSPEKEEHVYIERLIKWLEGQGYTTWCVERDASISVEALPTQILSAIGHSRVICEIISPRSIRSEQLTVEIRNAYDHNKPVIPILYNIEFRDVQQNTPSLVTLIGPRTYVRSSDCSLLGETISAAILGPVQPSEDPSSVKKTNPQYFEQAQFTVYRPRAIRPSEWYDLLFFAHPANRLDEGDEDPLSEVERLARDILGDSAEDYGKTLQDSSQSIPREGMITVRPSVTGLKFNPPERVFYWHEPVHRELFRIRADEDRVDQTLRGTISVYFGVICVADIPLTILVTGSPPPASSIKRDSARMYRKIFPSYSRRDTAVVNQFIYFTQSTGDRYLKDTTELRSGEIWSKRLRDFIVDADVFQLFWSQNSMISPHVRQEYEFALSLGRPNFIRPVFWEDPFPEDEKRDLPPGILKTIQFHKLDASCVTIAGFQAESLQRSLGEEAATLHAQGDLDGALRRYQQQEQICRELGSKDDLQASLGKQALILQDRGDLDGAMALHKEEERICRELGNVDGLQASLGNQALILKARGDLDGAMALLKELERICREIGNVEGLMISLWKQANIHVMLHCRRAASEALYEAEALASKVGNKKYQLIFRSLRSRIKD